jgi:hypothetical protein
MEKNRRYDAARLEFASMRGIALILTFLLH